MPLEFESTDWLDLEEREKKRIVEEIARSLPKDLFTSRKDYAFIEEIVRRAVLTRSDLVAPHEVDDIVKAIAGQATGYGALQEFFLGPGAEEITEVMVNPSPDGVPRVFYGKHGRPWYAGNHYFKDNEEALRYFQKICEDSGRPLTEDAPIVDAWLKDGSRLAVFGFKVSPLGVGGTIRKSPLVRPPMPLEKLVENGMLPEFAARMLVDLLVKGHANIGVFGRTDSGKTTFLRALALHIDPLERTFIAETSFELYLPNLQNCINLVEVVVGDRVVVDMGSLVRTMNRNNPDRSIVGEVRGKEIVAASRMAASTSGGFWTTGHAGNVASLRTALKGMYREAGIELPREDLDEEISSMFHFLIFLDKETLTAEARRTLMEVVEVVPGEGYRTVIRFDTGEFAATKGKVRRWIYENPVTPERLSMLAFRGAEVKPEYEEVKERYLC
ncbi:pilus assembly protein CpaF [Desulfofundulus luciae]|uniref:Pilus assembly protein CpaF n=1 Tax=Desulfofundulus luciae TaxID=74702 RepID=A0ABU0B461_9FIRM|nr:ATPase, T2SS/T4P/T4SS family [Desulfofundulus luciae]MDQ0287492.1 pilus assembly protein CpaF [Desulfofundulus luciae]